MIIARYNSEVANERFMRLDDNGDLLKPGIYGYDVNPSDGFPRIGPLGPYPSKGKARKAVAVAIRQLIKRYF